MATEKQIAANRKNALKAGRKKGKKTLKAMQREEALNHFRERTIKVTDILFDSQLSIAKGLQYLFRIDKEFVKTGTSKKGEQRGFWRAKKPVQVTSPEEMRQFLEDEFVNGDVQDEFDESASFYFLTAVPPNNQAIDSLMDRTHGRAKSELEVNIKVPKPIYGGKAVLSLPGAQRLLQQPKKVKATILTPDGKKIHEQTETVR